MLVIGRVVHQERFERLEEQPGVVADPLRVRRGIAQRAAQLGENELGAIEPVAAQHAAFELRDQQSPCARLELAQELTQTLDDRLTEAGHSGTYLTKIRDF